MSSLQMTGIEPGTSMNFFFKNTLKLFFFLRIHVSVPVSVEHLIVGRWASGSVLVSSPEPKAHRLLAHLSRRLAGE